MGGVFEAVIDKCQIEAVILETQKDVTLTIDVNENPKQKCWIGKKAGDTYKLPGFDITYKIKQIKEFELPKSKPELSRHPKPPRPFKPEAPLGTAPPSKSVIMGPYTYREVEERFGIVRTGIQARGINAQKERIVLVSSAAQSSDDFVYHDQWLDDGHYMYSGEGKKGDQRLTEGNWEIIHASENHKPLHLLIKHSSREYYYHGIFELVEYRMENCKDEAGGWRKEYRFILRKVL